MPGALSTIEVLRERLTEAKGIGTPATRAEIIGGVEETGFPRCPGERHRADRGRLVAVRCFSNRPTRPWSIGG